MPYFVPQDLTRSFYCQYSQIQLTIFTIQLVESVAAPAMTCIGTSCDSLNFEDDGNKSLVDPGWPAGTSPIADSR